jgi:hypothetical protein
MSNFEVEIQALCMDNKTKCELFFHNFDGYWNFKHEKFFCIFEERMDVQKLSMEGCDKGWISKLVSMYYTTSIKRA